ncbi:DUF1760-domain-containing protein [Xylariaceae sp. FL1651]|nr:DUF1760-domain-containing protein [Xylariaceae sp. FL1651]
MPELSESITAIREGAKEDHFTYLTILQYHVTTPGILPTLNEVLHNAELTQEIGWDLVQMLLAIDGSEDCLETVARLGNPREVIIKVMEALEGLAAAWEDDMASDDGWSSIAPGSKIPGRFITLLGMLAILQRRIKTKHRSRFLGPSLVKVYEAYQPTPEMTTGVINLVRSLSGRIRPPLPTRTSSINVANPDKDGDVSKNAPDPEAEQEDPTEENLIQKLLQSFTTCILQRHVNAHEMQWSPRLLETYHPEKIVPGKVTATKAFREDEVLQKRDAVTGQLVALLRDLDLNDCSAKFIRSIYGQPVESNPLAAFESFESPEDIHLSPGGVICLVAYWIFSTDIFSADNPQPEMHLFPEHLTMIERFLGKEPEAEISSGPGIADALLAIGLGLHHRDLIAVTEEASYMAYHHHLTLISVFHPHIQVRNAATMFAGTLLHSDPDDQSRLEILEDLLENCQFASLKACAVKWLQEELIAANQGNISNQFSRSEVIERLQYTIFPDMLPIADMDTDAFLAFWSENQPFLLQTANFAYFLFTGRRDLVPSGMKAAVEQRFAEPLAIAVKKFGKVEELDGDVRMQLDILADRLQSLSVH